jgi:hypothetical protein
MTTAAQPDLCAMCGLMQVTTVHNSSTRADILINRRNLSYWLALRRDLVYTSNCLHLMYVAIGAPTYQSSLYPNGCFSARLSNRSAKTH